MSCDLHCKWGGGRHTAIRNASKSECQMKQEGAEGHVYQASICVCVMQGVGICECFLTYGLWEGELENRKEQGEGVYFSFTFYTVQMFYYIYICLYTYIFVNIYMQRQLILNLTIACELFQTHKLLIQPMVVIHHVLRA